MAMLSYGERFEKTVQIGDKTFQDLLNKLNESGRCLAVRPCGFGKTFLLVKQVAMHYKTKYSDKKIVLLYPSNIIVNEIKSNAEYKDIRSSIKLISFQAVSLAYGSLDTDVIKSKSAEEQDALRKQKEKKKAELTSLFKHSSVVLIDEVHRAASSNLKEFFDVADDIFGADKTHLVGVTATINRQEAEETEWIKQNLFRGTEVFKYELSDAFNDGILLEPYIVQPIFNFDKQLEEESGRIISQSVNNKFFNREELEREVASMKFEWGNNGKDIYDAMTHVGFDLGSDNPDNSYGRFIVFFRNAKHMAEEGENIEEYFRLATNEVASRELGKEVKTEINVEYVISDTADINNDYIIKELCSKESYRFYRDNAEDVCMETYINDLGKKAKRYRPKKAHCIDLIFNINVIAMGYHVPDIAGVMQLRTTNTSILFYQQIGRCFSVKSLRQPIVFDVVSNFSKDFDAVSDKRACFNMKDFLESNSSGDTSDKEVRGDDEVYARQSGLNERATEDWLTRIKVIRDPMFTHVSRIRYLYEDRKMPVAYIAQNMNISCNDVISILFKNNVKIVNEDAECSYVESRLPKGETGYLINKDSKDTALRLKFINSKKASSLYNTLFKSVTSTLFRLFAKLVAKEEL